jgi:hypothetical protein
MVLKEALSSIRSNSPPRRYVYDYPMPPPMASSSQLQPLQMLQALQALQTPQQQQQQEQQQALQALHTLQTPQQQQQQTLQVLHALQTPQQEQLPLPQTPPQMSTIKTSRSHSLSSDDAPAGISNIVFPLLQKWFQDQDNHPVRGADNLNYEQWVAPLNHEGFLRLNDLDGLKESDLIEICPTMKRGIAKRMIEMVRQDVSVIKRGERKQARLQ